MSTPSRRSRPSLLAYAYLLPFAALGVYGAMALFGWWSGHLTLIQPRNYDPPLSANACLCLVLIGVAPIGLALGWRRAALALAIGAAVLAWATLIQIPLQHDLGIDDLLVRHEHVIAGSAVARMPAALSFLLMAGSLLFAWLVARPSDTRRPVLLGLIGSLTAAYGLTGLASYRTDLNAIDLWQQYAGLGPHTATLLVILGCAQIWLAARDNPDRLGAGPRWLWLPMVVCSLTVTFTFWVALSQREITYTNSTTQLTVNNIAAVYSGESEAMIEAFARQARRWTRTSGISQAAWETEVADFLADSTIYRSVQWVDGNLRTKWFWPRQGNEDADQDQDGEEDQGIAVCRFHGKFLMRACRARIYASRRRWLAGPGRHTDCPRRIPGSAWPLSTGWRRAGTSRGR